MERKGQRMNWTRLVVLSLVAAVCIQSVHGRSRVLEEVSTANATETVAEASEVVHNAENLPSSYQMVLLNSLGKRLASIGAWPCNIFGGKDTCEPVPEDFFQVCQGQANDAVDCAYRLEASEEYQKDPKDVMETKLTKAGYSSCPTCIDALHRMWCAQTAPTCGTFSRVVDEILPGLKDVMSGKLKPVELIESTMPSLMDSLALGLPCREMCDAVTASCNCGRPTAFGDMIAVLERKRKAGEAAGATQASASGKEEEAKRDLPFAFAANVSLITAMQVFKKIWSKPVCELFVPKDTPGFKGICVQPPAADSQACGWCSQDPRPADMDEEMVAEVSQSVSSMMQTGMEHILFAAAFHFNVSSGEEGERGVEREGDLEGERGGESTPAVEAPLPTDAKEISREAAKEVSEEEKKEFNWDTDAGEAAPGSEGSGTEVTTTTAEGGEMRGEGDGMMGGSGGHMHEHGGDGGMMGEGGSEGGSEERSGSKSGGNQGGGWGGYWGSKDSPSSSSTTNEEPSGKPLGESWEDEVHRKPPSESSNSGGNSDSSSGSTSGSSDAEDQVYKTVDTTTSTSAEPEPTWHEFTPAGSEGQSSSSTSQQQQQQPVGQSLEPVPDPTENVDEETESGQGSRAETKMEKPEEGGRGGGGGPSWAAIFFVMVAVTGVAAGVVYWRYFKERRSRDGGQQYVDLQEMGYKPPML